MTVGRGHDRYRLASRIATGGMGEVWRAEDSVLDREVAVKVLKPEFADDPTFRARFEAEARHAAGLSHPNIASVFDFGELHDEGSDTTRPFLVMELVPGQPLSELLRPGEPMPPERAADIVAQAADGIAAAHAMGLVHRDVKPANLLVTPDGTVKVTDFGIARAPDVAGVTQTGQIIGTPHYISPEQAEGAPASPASDIYALGVVLFECLTGRRPFARDTPIQVALAHVREPVPALGPNVPLRLREITDKALAKRPADRFEAADVLATALRGGTAPGVVAGAAAALDPDATRVLAADATAGHTGAPAGAEQPRDTRWPPWWPWAAAAAAVLAVVVTTSALVGGEPAPAVAEAPAAEAKETEPAAADQVRVREATYLGRAHERVREELEARGLDVSERRVPATSPAQQAGTVAAVRPTGLLAAGTTVTLEVWEAYQPVEDEDDHEDADEDDGEDHGKAKEDDASTGGNGDKPGKGKGRGKGKKD